jgi:hypothetical protein
LHVVITSILPVVVEAVQQVLKVRQVLRVQLVRKDLPERRVQYQVLLDRQDLKVQRETKVTLAQPQRYLDLKAQLALRGLKVILVQLVQLQLSLDLQDLKDLREMLDRKASRATRAQQARKVQRETRALLELIVRYQGRKDL